MFVEGIIVSVGVSNLQLVDMTLSRNLFVFGVFVILGLMLPGWLDQHPTAISTGATKPSIHCSSIASVYVIEIRSKNFFSSSQGTISRNRCSRSSKASKQVSTGHPLCVWSTQLLTCLEILEIINRQP